jgi:protein TonB
MLTSLLFAVMLAGADQDSLASVRELYASAAYEDALTALSRLPPDRPAEEARTIEQYRAFCLLALGRNGEAEHAIEAVIASAPNFRPSESDISPRVRAAFGDVRRRMLPSIIQQKYAQAKAAFDRKEFAAAAAGFTQVLTALADQDVAVEAKQPPLADLRTLAGGFLELAAKASAPPPAPVAAVVVAPPPPPAPVAPKIYSGGETGVVPPVVVNQSLPSFPGQVIIPRSGKLEIVIDESGSVESAVMRESVSQTYDAMVLSATRAWRYRPATANGTPVKFRKTVQITIKLTS